LKHRIVFNYYGGKGMLVNKYPPPKHKTIIEPFAGGAAYSLRWYKHNIILLDTNLKTIEAWNFVKSQDALNYINKIPKKVNAGDKINDIKYFDDFPQGLKNILRMSANIGTGGLNVKVNTITKIAVKHWYHNTILKIKFWHPKIQHWKILHRSYEDAPNITATWFIDPPYQDTPGRLYTENKLNYHKLATWVKSRRGQIICCENESANWLPFTRLTDIDQGLRGKNVRKNRPKECVFIKN